MSKRNVAKKPAKWETELEERLRLFGHRNWIVISDAAYPAHSGHGIETMIIDSSYIDVIRIVLKRIAAHEHIRCNAYTDLELKFVSERDALGITKLRRQIDSALEKLNRSFLPHETLIAKLDDSASTFRIWVLKTTLTLPYTSIFLELTCGYWNAEAERKLRQSMQPR